MIVTAPRASAILYSLLTSRADRRPFLIPANICAVVPLTFLKAGIPYTFVDIHPDTLNMNLETAARLVRTGAYGGLLYAHTYGDETTPADFFSEIKHHASDLLLVDDRCLCIPDLDPGNWESVDVTLYSTGYAKMVDLGAGGYAALRPGVEYASKFLPFRENDLKAIEQVYKADLARRAPYEYQDNEWLQTEPLPDWDMLRQKIAEQVLRTVAWREQINAIYHARLPESICLPERFQLWRYNLRVANQSAVLKTIFNSGLFASAHYASLSGVFAPGDCPQAESLAAQVINLFNDSHYTPEMAERTCDIILSVL